MLGMLCNAIEVLIHPRKALVNSRLRRAGLIPHDFYAYNLPWLVGRQFSLVLDIGAARGTHTLLFRRLFPNATIHAFEPQPEGFAELCGRMQNQPNVECHQCALSDRDGMTDFYLGGDGYADASSLLPIGQAHRELWPGSGTGQRVQVQTRRLDDVVEIDKGARIFVKMDVQGGELLVINGGLNVFSLVDTLVVEASMKTLYSGGTTFHDLYEKLHGLGFDYAGILEQNFSPSGTGEVIQNDVIFRRKESLLT